MNLVKTLKEGTDFSPTEKQIVEYVLANYQEIASLSARELAIKTYTSSAAVVRFCQKIGLKGYAEFKIKFASEAMRDNIAIGSGPNTISNRDTILSILDKITRIELEAIAETRNDVDSGQIMRAAQLLDHAEHIDFYAMDNNLHIAELACYCFLHAGKLSTVTLSTSAQYVQALASQKGHLAFIISRTGENSKLIEIASIARQRQNKIILLTAVRDSSLAKLADETLWVASEKNFNKLGTMVFLTGAKFMMDVLFSVLFAKHYDSTLNRNEIFEKMFRV